MEVQQEYARIKELFKGADENQLKLVDGAIMEAARLRVELDQLNKVVAATGLVMVNPDNPYKQRELPICRLLPKVRGNYTNLIFKLARTLGGNVDEDDLGLEEYE